MLQAISQLCERQYFQQNLHVLVSCNTSCTAHKKDSQKHNGGELNLLSYCNSLPTGMCAIQTTTIIIT